MATIRVIDSHTGGEPTRLVSTAARASARAPWRSGFSSFASISTPIARAIVNEPRGSDTLVGALLLKPQRADCDFGVIFFNNVGYLGMCGHGTMGLIESLRFAGELAPGTIRIDTPVGAVDAELHADGRISVGNVASYRSAQEVAVEVPGIGEVEGDVAWGGNWFFLISRHGQSIDLHRVEALTDYCWRVRAAINAQGHPLVDHVELFAPSNLPGAHSRNFVLCPGKAYDRSPCGTGTSAKLACLAADGELGEGEAWIQESLIGSTFIGSYRWRDRAKGRNQANLDGHRARDRRDPFCILILRTPCVGAFVHPSLNNDGWSPTDRAAVALAGARELRSD